MSKKTSEKPVKIPIKFEDAIDAFLKTPPEPKKKLRPKRKKRA